MKIALVTSNYPRQTGTFDQREINGLRKAGAEIDVFPIYPLNKDIFNDPKVLATLEGQEPLWEKVHAINALSSSYLLGIYRLIADSELMRESMVAMRQYYNQDIVSLAKITYSIPKAFAWVPLVAGYSHIVSFWGNYSGTVAYFMAKKLKLPYFTYLHAGTDLYRNRAFLLEKLLYAHTIITVCKYNINFLEKIFPTDFHKFKNKIIIHYLGLDLSRYKVKSFDIDSPVFKICCIGSLEKYKGSFQVLKSFNALIKGGCRAELTFCGNGPLLRKLQSFCKENQLNNFVEFKGICSIDDVKRVMQSSHVLIHGSPFEGDSAPTVIKEAMALGRPVIATTIAGIPELVEDKVTGLLVEPDNIDSLTQAINYLNENREIAEKMGLNGRFRAEKLFNLWENTASLLKSLSQ